VRTSAKNLPLNFPQAGTKITIELHLENVKAPKLLGAEFNH
jgi:hypothetical protein